MQKTARPLTITQGRKQNLINKTNDKCIYKLRNVFHDISEDLKSWARIKTEFIEGEYKFELPKPNPSKLFIRSSLMKF